MSHRFKRMESGAIDVRDQDATYIISHYDAEIIVLALGSYRRLLEKRWDDNPNHNLTNKIEDLEYIYEAFTEIVGTKNVIQDIARKKIKLKEVQNDNGQ